MDFTRGRVKSHSRSGRRRGEKATAGCVHVDRNIVARFLLKLIELIGDRLDRVRDGR